MQKPEEEMEWKITRHKSRGEGDSPSRWTGRLLGMEFSAGNNMTYADEAMTGVTASSGTRETQGEQTEVMRPV